MRYHLIRSLTEYSAIIKLSHLNQHGLWLHFDKAFTSYEISMLSNSIPTMKGILWNYKFVAKDIDYTIAETLKTTDKNVVKTILDVNNTDVDRKLHKRLTHLQISWIDDIIAEQIGETVLLGQATNMIAILPYNDETAWQWSNITYGLAWYSLWLHSRPKSEHSFDGETGDIIPPKSIFDVDSFLANYVQLTLHIGGIPSLPIKDINAQPSLIFLGSSKLLEKIVEQIDTVATPYSDEEFKTYYNRFDPTLVHHQVIV